MRTKLLFVDDEPAVLESLSDLLFKERRRWEMSFVRSGECALEQLATRPFDIVVADMRMPGMDGARLLSRVKAMYPSTTRIMLSGQADKEALMRVVTVAHQFLSKPCDGMLLRSTLERTQALRARIDSEAVRAAAGSVEQLPSVPRTYLELVNVAADPSKGLSDVARVIETDTGMSAKVLQLVSSAYFGTRRNIRTIQQATALLGVDLLKGLTLTANAFAAAANLTIPGFCLEHLQRLSMTRASAARLMAPPPLADEAFTAALVQDIGRIVLAFGMPEALTRVHELATSRSDQLHTIETELLGVTHAEVGAYLLGIWGLPFTILEAVAYHHTPSSVADGNREILAIVHASDALVASASGCTDTPLDEPFLEQVGMSHLVPAWRTVAAECVRAAQLS